MPVLWISRLGHGVCFGMVGYLFFLGSMLVLLEGACNLLECALGRYSSDALTEWQLPVGFDAEGAARRVAAELNVWTDGSLVEDQGLWCFFCWGGLLHLSLHSSLGELEVDEDVGEDAVAGACWGFCSVPCPLQSVQRAEFWGVILALQANDGVHLGVDNLSVVRHVGRHLDGKTASRPAELVNDGILVCP